eukprot:905778-Prymnesium_polylepis.1
MKAAIEDHARSAGATPSVGLLWAHAQTWQRSTPPIRPRAQAPRRRQSSRRRALRWLQQQPSRH